MPIRSGGRTAGRGGKGGDAPERFEKGQGDERAGAAQEMTAGKREYSWRISWTAL